MTVGSDFDFTGNVEPVYGPFTFDADNGDSDESAWTFVSDNSPTMNFGLNPANTRQEHGPMIQMILHSTNVGPTSGQGGSPDGYVYTEASASWCI